MIRLEQPDLKIIEHLVQQKPNGISFAQGAARIGGVDARIKERVREILLTDHADYYSHSLGLGQLRQALIEYVQALHTVVVPLEQIAVTHGSIGGISALCQMLLEHGDEVLLPEPTYPAYFNAIGLAKGIVRTVPGYSIQQQGATFTWQLDFDRIVHAITPATKLIIIAQPSNPAGVCLTQEQLHALVLICQERGIYLLVDEAYDNYFFDAPAVSATAYAVKYDRVIRVGTFSKTFGMSGWRIGFMVAAPAIITQLAAVHDGSIVCPSVPGQIAAMAALEYADVTALYSQYVRQGRDLAMELLAPLQQYAGWRIALPAAGFFFFIQTPYEDTTQLVHTMLKDIGVGLVPGRNFGPSGHSCIRLCFARLHATLQEGCTRMVNYYGQAVIQESSVSNIIS